MKNRRIPAARTALALSAALALTAAPQASWGLGLGRLEVQSALGEALRAEIDITSLTPEEASTLVVRIATPEAYRAAGVDYNAVLAASQTVLARRGDGRPYLRVISDRAVQEPFVDVILELSWASGKLVREFTLLFDPPNNRIAPQVQAAAPIAPRLAPPLAASPGAAPAAPAATLPRAPARTADAAPRAASRLPGDPGPATLAAPATAAAPASPRIAGPDEYRVRNGDSLSRIAARTQRPGVDLEQMLVGLFRANPDAFIQRNMNRLRSGVVLAVPPTDTVKAITPGDAREVIQAQSADFNSYRRRLAEGAPAASTDDSGRQAKGRVSAALDDRKQPAAAPSDRLTLSGGAVKASAPEGQIAKAVESKDSAARLAELTRNVEELKKLLQGATAAQPGAGPVAAAPVAPVPAPGTTAATRPTPAPAPAPAPGPGPTPAPAPAPAPVPVPVPTAGPVPASPALVSPPAATGAVTAAPVPPLPVAVKPAPGPSAAAGDEPSLLDSLADSPNVLLGAGALVLALLGLALYRYKARAGAKDHNDTSFLESRVQPDSFFGASGGQRVDTSDASAGSSSMGFSLSQLDAIGDVDPVAEADVYLAYGRDLQAEEILKEAMRAHPDRLAVRTKLLEVYAKRRDTRGFELLAMQLFSLTKGTGPDWDKAQAMGLQFDPENPLYQPGGHPAEVMRGGDKTFVEPLGATTQPASSMMPQGASGFGPSLPAGQVGGPLDLELDLDLGQPEPPVTAMEATRPLVTNAVQAAPNAGLDFDFTSATTAVPPRMPAAPPAKTALDFDFDPLSLNLPPAEEVTQRLPAQGAGATSSIEFDQFDLSAPMPFDDAATTPRPHPAPDVADPISRKLELAEEFRQIGDLEGARDLLEEVIGSSSGALKAKAQGMLNQLG